LVPDGLLLDFHPVCPPWPRVVARGEQLGELHDETFLDELHATEAGMLEAVRRGLFEHLATRRHDLAEHYADPLELLESWADELSNWMSAELEQRLRTMTEPVDVVDRLVFHLYRRR
jgi:hypothetical protein